MVAQTATKKTPSSEERVIKDKEALLRIIFEPIKTPGFVSYAGIAEIEMTRAKYENGKEGEYYKIKGTVLGSVNESHLKGLKEQGFSLVSISPGGRLYVKIELSCPIQD